MSTTTTHENFNEGKFAAPDSSDTSLTSLAAERGAEPQEARVDEMTIIPDESADRTSGDFLARPVRFIGGYATGNRRELQGWLSGKVMTRIRVFRERDRIQAYTIWLSGDNGVTFGNSGTSEFREYTFADGELITSLTLWGNGIGTRAGYIRFTTSRNTTFEYGMTNRLGTPFHVEVGSGICVGVLLNVVDDIHAHGFYFLNHIENSELTHLRYPTLAFDAMGISPHSLRRFRYRNSSRFPRTWEFSDTVTETRTSSWSVTSGLSVHSRVSVTAGVPMVAQVQGEFGWEVSSSSTHTETEEIGKEFSWNLSGEVSPGEFIDLQAVTRKGKLNIPYEGTMVVRMRNGGSFSYNLKGWYKGVDFSDVKISHGE